VYFQALDDKKHCIGIYYDGKLIFDEQRFPKNLANMRTWRYSGFLNDDSIKYGWFRSGGKTLLESCPPDLKPQLSMFDKKMKAFKKSFELAKVDFREHCFFDLVPHDFLHAFLEFKNQVTAHVFETYEQPKYYDHLVSVEKLLYKIRYQELNINNTNARGLFASSGSRGLAQKLLNGRKTIDYNIFGTRTGRLSTNGGSFPILTMQKVLRALVKPVNDWFISLDYNGAEARTVLGLLGIEQPTTDVHQWNIDTILKRRGVTDREAAKTFFFSWLYNPASTKISDSVYDREAILEKYYFDNHVHTIFDRVLEVDEYKAVNYVIQSTTADLVNDRAVKIDKFLEGKRSFISHIVHDEIVLDMPDDERYLIPEVRDIFSNNKLGHFKTNLKAGKDYMDIGTLNL
tara:strand:+ start:4456 stop:5658 length:1203 start_codon:yes stop_codon:yes gene_type:complete